MVCAALVGIVLARKVSVRARMNAVAETRAVGQPSIKRIAGGIFLTSVAIEAACAAILFVRFLVAYNYGVGRAAWSAVFHAVSAFNNAGFALYSDSMMGFASDGWILLPLCAAIIVGGIGFPVLRQLRRELRTPLHRTMNTRIVLIVTAALLVISTLAITTMEWSNPDTLGSEGYGTRIRARPAGAPGCLRTAQGTPGHRLRRTRRHALWDLFCRSVRARGASPRPTPSW
ncbi:potassium transporter TrkG [Microbacterium sp. ZXX196]|uniref:potassium transporter TrkG n=1 Tax=Microbacterium sp. ZXX196 TaxID=2609291 RepID=UPI0012B8DB9D|nr:potassium transporter TrkG [Microbacterium sp. ZXX196]MTE23041.1 hypothetical protein [Microbacterium sp. ZXX196]